MKKLISMLMLVCFLAVGIFASSVYAGGKGCKKGSKQKHSISEKFFKKAHFIFENKKELGITDEQLEKVKELKIDAKKDKIRKTADIEIIALDIKVELYNDSPDKNKINALIDKKYAIKKEKAKNLIDACIKLKAILTEEQKDKMAELCKKQKAKCEKCRKK